jgi:MazG family protein
VSDVSRLLEIMARLREPVGGCPWDLEQTFETIAPYTIEEAYEVDDAIRRGDFDALRDELGDLLLQVVFHAQMANEAGRFDFGDVVDAVCDKLERRHPHVFGDADIATAEAQTDAWEAQKALERARRGETSVVDGIPLGLPSLLRSRKLFSRARRAGFQLPKADVALHDLRVALGDLEAGDEAAFGSLLLASARFAHAWDIDPEETLRDALSSFEGELRVWESEAGEGNR